MNVVAFKPKPRRYCELIELSLERHERDLATLPKDKYRFNEDSYLEVVDFAESFLYFPDGTKALQPVTLADYQIEHFIKPLFGWEVWDDESNKWLRRFRTAYIQLPKKNAKSFLLAVIGAYLLIADGQYGAKCYSAATGIKQAKIVHDFAKSMLSISERNGALKGYVDVVANTIAFETAMSSWTVLTGDPETNDGILPHYATVDEYHRWKTDELIQVIRKGMITGEQPLFIMITTAGDNLYSPCYQERVYAERILRQEYNNESYFAYIAEPDKDDDWKDPVTHEKVNPGLGITIRKSAFNEEFQKALTSKGEELKFKRLNLNMWVNISDYWLDMEKWNNPTMSFVPDALKGMPCYVGVDLSTRDDMTAVSYVFDLSNETIAVLPFFFVPIETIDYRTRAHGVPYRNWYEEGYLIATEGNAIDQQAVRKNINDMAKIYDIKEIAVDRWESTQIVQQLTEEDGFIVESMGQGYKSLNAPSKWFEGAVKKNKVIHNMHPVLSWNAGNAAITTDPTGSIKPDKTKCKDKIDGIAATLNAVGRYLLHVNKAVGEFENKGVILIR
jgi:phage terminase large subunit-like protein